MDRPLLILTTGRGGSSLVAGLFAAHGVWVGPYRHGDHNNKKGYFENQAIKQAMLNLFGRDFLARIPESKAEWPQIVKNIIEKQGYVSGPWLFKTGAAYWQAWTPFDPIYVKVFRNKPDILASYERCGFLKNYTDEEIDFIVSRQLDLMKTIPGPDIDVDLLVRGNTDQLQHAIEAAGLEFDPKTTEDFIDPRLWNEIN